MATILLSAAGAAIGSGFGGSVLGMSGAVIGRAIGATAGRALDQRLLGGGGAPVDTGKVERFRVTGASEGSAIPRAWGRVRLPGQVIWSSRFLESTTSGGSGKGTSSQAASTGYSYTVSIAVALCEGEIRTVGRVWADGIEQARTNLNMRIYKGSEDQIADPKIEAVEGYGNAPSYRGIAYVVIEDLDLSRFGNRVPQFSFEVVRPSQGAQTGKYADAAQSVRAVALFPGTGEYALATTPVYFKDAPGVSRSINTATLSGDTDFQTSLDQLTQELPKVGSVSLVVSWFGSDLRCNSCQIRPKVEQSQLDGTGMPWKVSGVSRSAAVTLPTLEGSPVYGGTPADAAVIEAIVALHAANQEVMFYPFILMDQLSGNGLTDPWSGSASQPALPWRGRITTSLGPGMPGTPNGTPAAANEVDAFLGVAQPEDFAAIGQTIVYSGPEEWSFRRFILHYAKLCQLAGGVEAFCIGSEMRGLTQVRGVGTSFPAVAALCQLAEDVRTILGPNTKITYAADWSEYFGYQDGGNVFFHLDPLWANPAIDMIGIDNYMPLSDWRDGQTHADSQWGSIYNIDYLKGNVEGGEGYDWYYDSPEGVAAQLRRPIVDAEHGENWVYRYKDLRGWWQNPHHERINGVRSATATAWVPQSKPFWFTEYGCAAIDKATNQPNLFLDAKSSESALPRASSGHRDDLVQAQYLRAVNAYWKSEANNPVSTEFPGRMVDIAHCFAWAWDTRPYPAFPANATLWSDGENYSHGHWLNGRASNQLLSGVLDEICSASGLIDLDASAAHGIVRGYSIVGGSTGRSDLQPMLLSEGLDVFEREGSVRAVKRTGYSRQEVQRDDVALHPDLDGRIEFSRQADAEIIGRVRLDFVLADADFQIRTIEAVFPDEQSETVAASELPLALTLSEAKDIAERWLSEARVARDSLRLALPMSQMSLGSGDVITVDGESYRIDSVESTELQLLDALRVHPGTYQPGDEIGEPLAARPTASPVPVFPVFLDLPLLSGDELPHAPHFAVVANPWLGSAALWSSTSDSNYGLTTLVERGATFGVTENALLAERSGTWGRGAALRVKLSSGSLSSVAERDVLSGANTAVIGDGTTENWEVFQFRSAVLVAPGTYEISLRLRGQAGSNGTMPQSWPVGSQFLLLNSAVQQLALSSSTRGISRNYRTGLASLGYDDLRVVHQEAAFSGIGLRPYSVAHVSRTGSLGADVQIVWIRRTRLDGDSWEQPEVPLGEDQERYLVRIQDGTLTRRETEVTMPSWTYTLAMQISDGVSPAATLCIAQISDRFGPGPFVSISL